MTYIRTNNPIDRAISLEINLDGSMCLRIRSKYASWMLGLKHRSKRGGCRSVWWLIDPAGNPENKNFEEGHEAAKQVAASLEGILEELERAAAVAMKNSNDPLLRVKALEAEVTALREELARRPL